jgi:hypothetical protein
MQKSSTKYYQTKSKSTFKILFNMIKWDSPWRWFNVLELKNVIHHINRMKISNHILISTDEENTFNKISISSG